MYHIVLNLRRIVMFTQITGNKNNNSGEQNTSY